MTVSQKPKIVVKIGDAWLFDAKGNIDQLRVERIAMLLTNMQNSGKRIILVTAGSMFAAREKLGLHQNEFDLSGKQALAAIGQVELMKTHQRYFDVFSQPIAQVLLTRKLMNSHNRIRNAQNTLNKLLEMNFIPIINENDTVSTEDIELEDNYPLAAVVAILIDAHLLIDKSDQDTHYHIIERNKNKVLRVVEEDKLLSTVEELIKNSTFRHSEGHKKPFPLSIDKLSY